MMLFQKTRTRRTWEDHPYFEDFDGTETDLSYYDDPED
jgi:hypothetical protein